LLDRVAAVVGYMDVDLDLLSSAPFHGWPRHVAVYVELSSCEMRHILRGNAKKCFG
jgi:hypothetical protein